MAGPVGHALVGMALGRRLGLTSRRSMAGAVVAAGLPDVDVLAGLALHRDPWRLHVHGAGTHTLGFAVVSGALAGACGLFADGPRGDRDRAADALTGAILVGSHILLDAMPLPYLKRRGGTGQRPRRRTMATNWVLDAVVYGVVARVVLTAGRRHAAGEIAALGV